MYLNMKSILFNYHTNNCWIKVFLIKYSQKILKSWLYELLEYMYNKDDKWGKFSR